MTTVDQTTLDDVDVTAPAKAPEPSTPQVQQSAQPPNNNGADLYQTGPNTSNQFIRRWSLTLSGAGNQTWSISDSNASGAQSGGTAGPIKDPLRITFQTRQIGSKTRGSLEVTIWNLARAAHPIKDLTKLYNRITLRAGYQTGQFGTIFDGTIVDFHQGRSPNLTEVYLQILAGDGDLPYNVATTNISYKAGTTATEVLKSVVGDMEKYGAIADRFTGIPLTPLIRGVVNYGMSKDMFKKFGMDTYITQNKLTVLAPGSQFQNNTWEINAKTGLVGMAEATGDQGIKFRCLLNPKLNMYDTVHLDNNAINTGIGANNPTGLDGVTSSVLPNLTIGWYVDPSTDGLYTVWVVEHSGDTRGNEWYTDVKTWPPNTPVSPGVGPLVKQYGVDATKGQQKVATTPPTLPPDETGGYYQPTGDTVI